MKKTYRTNFRVEVAVDDSQWKRPRDGESRLDFFTRLARDDTRLAEEIENQICRHVDVKSRDVSVNFDYEGACEHCGSAWTEDGQSYNGGCCDEDEKGNPETVSQEREE